MLVDDILSFLEVPEVCKSALMQYCELTMALAQWKAG